jgi:transposase
MTTYPKPAMERAMKIQEVIMRVYSKQLLWVEAAEILGISPRSMRRWKRRYELYHYDGLFDRRTQRPSPKRVSVAVVQEVLRLKAELYHDCNVRHFHEKLGQEHGIGLSYEWVKKALQMAGVVGKGKRCGVHRQRRERRGLRGMLLFCDGSTHRWLPEPVLGQQDLIAFIDDATSEVYEAYLVQEEGTLTVLQGLKPLLEREGLFCSLYTDRAGHFFHTPKAGQAVDKSQLTQIGRALAQLGIEHIPSYSPQARGRMERFFGSWQARLPQELRLAGVQSLEQANRYIREVFMPWHNTHRTVTAREAGTAFVAVGAMDVEGILCLQAERVVAADNTVAFGRMQLQLAPVTWRCSFAKCRVKVCEHLDGRLSVRLGPRVLGWYSAEGEPIAEPNQRAA